MSHALRRSALMAMVAVPAVLLAGCGSSDNTSGGGGSGGNAAGANTVKISFTDDGCAPQPATVPAGALTFDIENNNASRVTEAEVMQNGRILGEKENLTPGLSGSFSLRLEAGEYVIACPNAATDQHKLTVTAGGGGSAATDTTLTTAVASYQSYVENQANALVPAVKAFTDAVKAGDVAKARTLFAPARAPYERIEPIAESFGDLDPDIDAREGDVPAASWGGFHRIEKALWVERDVSRMGTVADKLLADVTKLQGLVKTVKLQPAQIANGAVELLGEVAKSKITGEEDRYSHTDLWDFEANVAGAREAFQVLEPALKAKNPALATTLNQRFADVLAALAKYQKGAGYVDYSTVDAGGRRELTTVVDALAEPLSKVAPAIV
jgi:iron uptake system component EfeO